MTPLAGVLAGCLLAAGTVADAPPRVVKFLGGAPGESDAQVLARRTAAGLNVQWLVVPAEGTLADPLSVRVTWNGEPVRTHAYYTDPEVLLVFGFPPPGNGGGGTTTLAGAVLGGETEAWGTVTFDGTTTPSAVVTPTPGPSRDVRLLLEDGTPAVDGWLFGQRRADLLAPADGQGRVRLTALTRNTPDAHYAWAGSTWTLACDPRTSETITLPALPAGVARGWLDAASLDAFAATSTGRVVSGEDAGGGRAVLAWIDRTFWVRPDPEGRFPIPHRSGEAATEVILLAPGFAPSRRMVVPMENGGEVEIPLSRRSKPLI